MTILKFYSRKIKTMFTQKSVHGYDNIIDYIPYTVLYIPITISYLSIYTS